MRLTRHPMCSLNSVSLSSSSSFCLSGPSCSAAPSTSSLSLSSSSSPGKRFGTRHSAWGCSRDTCHRMSTPQADGTWHAREEAAGLLRWRCCQAAGRQGRRKQQHRMHASTYPALGMQQAAAAIPHDVDGIQAQAFGPWEKPHWMGGMHIRYTVCGTVMCKPCLDRQVPACHNACTCTCSRACMRCQAACCKP